MVKLTVFLLQSSLRRIFQIFHNEICGQLFEMNRVYRPGEVYMLSYVNLLLKRFVSLENRMFS